MPWLFTDPGASQPVGGDSAEHQPAAIADAASAHEPSPRDVEPTLFERPHADSRAVTPRSQPAIDAAPWAALPPTPRLDAAAVLESIAARIRGGQIDASDADAASGEATVLVTVLAALLRQQGR